jgi:uncharacterized protein (TIGR02996 family)
MTHNDFMQEILANPDDDTPRLIYADWLDEYGDSLQAEFIRTQCELAKFPRHDPQFMEVFKREHPLRLRYEPIWRQTIPTWLSGASILLHRGFGGVVRTTIPYFTKYAARLAKLFPVQHVYFSIGEPFLIRLLRNRQIESLRTIEIDYCRFTRESYRMISACPRLQRLVGLRLHREANLDMPSIKVLMDSVNLRSLKILSCPTAEGVVQQFLSEHFPKWSAP